MNNSKVYSYEEALKSIRNNYNEKDIKIDDSKFSTVSDDEISDEVSNLSKNDNNYLNYLFTIFCLIVIFLLFIFFLSIK